MTIKVLSAREQQIIRIIYQKGKATVNEVMEEMPSPLSNSAIRTYLRILEGKNQLTHIEEDGKFYYHPLHRPYTVAISAIQQAAATFFEGDRGALLTLFLKDPDTKMTSDELSTVGAAIKELQAKK